MSVAVSGYTTYRLEIKVCGNLAWDIPLTKNSTQQGTNVLSGMSKDPVNTATGNYVYQHRDMQLPGKGMPFVFERSYNSQAGSDAAATSGPLGFGWTHNYKIALTVDAGNVTVNWGDGKTETYAPNGAGGFTPQYGVFDTLIANAGGTYTLKKKNLTTYNFDATYNLTSIVDRNGNTLALTYTGANLTRVTDTAGRNVDFTYDASNRIVTITDPIARTVQFTYDANGNRLSMTDPNNHVTTYTYDVLNRLIAKAEPLGTTQYQYDAVGNRTQVTQPNGTIIHYAYDNLDRLQTITYPDSTTVSFTYDFDGNRTGMVDALGTSSAQYDALGRMTSYTDAYGKTVGYGYDANGNRTSLTYPGSKTVTYAYDALNRMTSVTDWLTHQTTYSYDAAGRMTGSNGPNGVATTYGFDNANRLTSLSHAQGTTVIASYAYTLDEIGNHKQVTQTEPLPAVVTPGTANYTYDTDNRLTAINGVSNSYDLNGNMTAKGADTYIYDYEDRLKQSTVGGTASQYQYDGLGHRYAKTNVGATTRYVLDLNGTLSKVLMGTDSAGAANAYYVYGLGLISRISAAGVASYYHFDTRGSTIALTDSAGTVTDKYAYNPFGNLTNSQGTTPNPFKYVRQYGVMDEGNSLQYIRARYYDTQTGRFINKDPKTGNDKDGQSLNRYVYAQNNPVRLIDFDGNNAVASALLSIGMHIGMSISGTAIETAISSKVNPYYDSSGSFMEKAKDFAVDVVVDAISSWAGVIWSVVKPIQITDSENCDNIDNYLYCKQIDAKNNAPTYMDENGSLLNSRGSVVGNMNSQTTQVKGYMQAATNVPKIPEIIEVQSYKYKTYKK